MKKNHGHVRATCSNPRHEGNDTCMVCNLYLCKVCFGFEGTLTWECPKVEISDDDQQLIYKSTLDFRDGRWINRSDDKHALPIPGIQTKVDDAVRRLNEARTED